MNYLSQIRNRIYSRESLIEQVEKWKKDSKQIVFTNGCFDIIHPGHADYLARAAALGDKLIIALNSDASVSRLKGSARPIITENGRAKILASFAFTDAVAFFDEDTPENLINIIIPDVLVKGKDYEIEDIVGADVVVNNGGRVETIELTEGFSTSLLVDKIKNL